MLRLQVCTVLFSFFLVEMVVVEVLVVVVVVG